jgi:hypothetical protein
MMLGKVQMAVANGFPAISEPKLCDRLQALRRTIARNQLGFTSHFLESLNSEDRECSLA